MRIFSCLMSLLRGRKPSILDLPPELMGRVLQHLSLVSQACLVLSCKKIYQQFKYIVEAPALRYPYSDGPDLSVDMASRIQLLSKLETRRFLFRRWMFCVSCSKLHPRKDFCQSAREDQPGTRICKWPGVIILCPCVRIWPKRLTHLLEQVNQSNDTNSSGPDIRKHIRNWHQCEFSDGELSYKLSISLFCGERQLLLIHFDYLIDVNQSGLDYSHVGRRIMLCSHVTARSSIKRNKDCPSVDCRDCGIHCSVRVLRLEDRTRYLIEFVRKYRPLGDPGDGLFASWRHVSCDYNWSRYRIMKDVLETFHGTA